MSFKQKAFWLHLFAVSVPVVATALVPVLQATGNPFSLAGALLLTSLVSYHWGSVDKDNKPTPEKDTAKALIQEAIEAYSKAPAEPQAAPVAAEPEKKVDPVPAAG